MTTKLLDALKKLDPKNDNQWNASGEPRIETVKMYAAGETVTRESLNAVAPGFTRDNSATYFTKGDTMATASSPETVSTASGDARDTAVSSAGTASSVKAAPATTPAGTPGNPTAQQLATTARNLVVGAQPVTLASAVTFPETTSLEIAADMTGRKMDAGYFTGMGDQADVLGDLDGNGEVSQSELDAAQGKIEAATKGVDDARAALTKAQRDYDQLLDLRDQGNTGPRTDPMAGYKKQQAIDIETRIAKQKAQDGQFVPKAPIDTALAAETVARRKQGS